MWRVPIRPHRFTPHSLAFAVIKFHSTFRWWPQFATIDFRFYRCAFSAMWRHKGHGIAILHFKLLKVAQMAETVMLGNCADGAYIQTRPKPIQICILNKHTYLHVSKWGHTHTNSLPLTHIRTHIVCEFHTFVAVSYANELAYHLPEVLRFVLLFCAVVRCSGIETPFVLIAVVVIAANIAFIHVNFCCPDT